MMKKQTQQPRVKTGLCVRRYLGNSSEMEVTMVSMVANWNGARKGTAQTSHPTQKLPQVLCVSHQGKPCVYWVVLRNASPAGSRGLCSSPTHKASKGIQQDVNLRNCLSSPQRLHSRSSIMISEASLGIHEMQIPFLQFISNLIFYLKKNPLCIQPLNSEHLSVRFVAVSAPRQSP